MLRHFTCLEDRVLPISSVQTAKLVTQRPKSGVADTDFHNSFIDSLRFFPEVGDGVVTLAIGKPLREVWLTWDNNHLLSHIYSFLFVSHCLGALQLAIPIPRTVGVAVMAMSLLGHGKFAHFDLILIQLKEPRLILLDQLANSLGTDYLQIFVHFRILILGLVHVITVHSRVLNRPRVADLSGEAMNWEIWNVPLVFDAWVECFVYLR